MMRYEKLKPQLSIDVAFVFLLALFYFILNVNMPILRPDLKVLFYASYILLALGVLVLFLIFSMNPRLALLTHIAAFPFMSVFYLFLKWLPEVVRKVVGEPPYGMSPGTFFSNLLAYLLLLLGYLFGQLALYLHERRVEVAPV